MATEGPETRGLIASDKVEGTAVFGADGQKIGSIQRVMIEKVSGKVSYAVLTFGGFLGIGDDYYPLPWTSLKYKVELGGYQTMVPLETIEGAPKYARSDTWDWNNRDHAHIINDYYGMGWDSPSGAGGFPASDENFHEEWMSLADRSAKDHGSR